MESVADVGKDDDQMELPPGFRFHPTDEELISHYLLKKVMDVNFSAKAIGEADLNKSEPWELPSKQTIRYRFLTRNIDHSIFVAFSTQRWRKWGRISGTSSA
ncbi:hypothetical protein SAY86_006629 [Trapa natans]|uniref:NAC domain-containing protein n=1 Tax=Trapa natans TaxID=22666 RepID=A0AAN7QWB7_TRANT|nr:hypothetical protein SAY86_006629 [Trapa natans]